jgi:hypothetical protein
MFGFVSDGWQKKWCCSRVIRAREFEDSAYFLGSIVYPIKENCVLKVYR